MRSRWISSFACFGLCFWLLPACDDDGGATENSAGGPAANGGSAGKTTGGASGSASSGRAGGGSGGQTQAAGGGGNSSLGGGGGGVGATSSGGKSASTGGRASSSGAGEGGAGETGGSGGSGGDAGEGGPAGSAGEAGESDPGAGGETGSVDPFGISELYPSASPASEWTSEHWSEGPYEIDGRTDEHDPLGLSGMRGEGSVQVNAKGELVMGGSQPRIYVYPGSGGPWQNVEITVYYRRIEDAATAYAGLVVGVRSGADGHTDSNACDAHTYYARLRHDGAIDFEKELEHPASSTRSRVNPQTVWPPDGELPFDRWIGWKFVIYNLPSGNAVRLEAYRDLTEGEGGGDWVLMNQTVDDGDWSVETACSEHDPSFGESEMVIVDGGTAFVRNTDVTEARYKWFSVREIDAD
jgi:hypothetical protein